MAKKRKRKLQNGGRVLTAQEKIAQQILSGHRPAQRQSAARRKGRTTSKLLSDEAYDRASNFLPDPRVFRKAYEKYQAGENLSRQDKINLGIEGAFGAAALIPGFGFVAQKGKPMVKSIVKKGAELLGESSKKLEKPKPPTAPRTNVKTGEVTSGSARPLTGAAKQSMLKKAEKGTQKSKETANQRQIAQDIKKKRGGAGKPPAVINKPPAVTPPKSNVPAKRKPTTPANPAGQKRGFDLGSTKSKNKRNLLGPLAGGTLAATTAAYLTQSEKDAKPAAGSQATKNKAPYVEGYNMDMDDFDSPKPSYPKPPKTSKPAKEADDGYRYYGKEGTGLGDFSRKYEIKYATPEQFEKDFNMDDGEKRGGRPGKSKMKTQGLNRSKRSGFSGRGTGAALRGF